MQYQGGAASWTPQKGRALGCAPPLLLDRWGLGGLASCGVTGYIQKLGRAPTGLCTPVAVPQVDGAGECASGVGVVSVQSSLLGWDCRLCCIIAQGHWLGSLPGPDHKAVVQQEGRAVDSAPLAWAVGSEAAQSPWLCRALASVHHLCWAACMTLCLDGL